MNALSGLRFGKGKKCYIHVEIYILLQASWQFTSKLQIMVLPCSSIIMRIKQEHVRCLAQRPWWTQMTSSLSLVLPWENLSDNWNLWDSGSHLTSCWAELGVGGRSWGWKRGVPGQIKSLRWNTLSSLEFTPRCVSSSLGQGQLAIPSVYPSPCVFWSLHPCKILLSSPVIQMKPE